jgi:hypothetical protein
MPRAPRSRKTRAFPSQFISNSTCMRSRQEQRE